MIKILLIQGGKNLIKHYGIIVINIRVYFQDEFGSFKIKILQGRH